MKNPLRRSAVFLSLAASLIFTWPAAGKDKSPAASADQPTRQSPHLLLAKVWDPTIDPTGWWMSEKYDGLRCYWDGEQLWSRKGKAIHAPAYFEAELPHGVVLDGELWIGHGQFEETLSTVLSETPGERWKKVRFMVFDAPKKEGTFEERMKYLQATLPAANRFVRVVAQERCRGKGQLLAERDRVVAQGAEGLMLRQPDSAYEAKRSPTLLKVKPYDDAEATIIAYEPGKGKFAGQLGALRVRTEDGREFSLGSGFNDAQRESPPAIGTVITYRYRGLTAKGMPRFPSFLRVRRE